MIIDINEFRNNFSRYIGEALKEEIIITCDGKNIAKLLPCAENVEINNYSIIKDAVEAYLLTPRKVTYEEFLEITENSDERYEYIDGEIYLLASPRTTHQRILGYMYLAFSKWFEGKKCRPMLSPYDITLKRNEKDINVVQPDIMIICNLEENINENDYYMGVPTLMVEILSESSRSKDSIKKLDLYKATGVLEYWVINPFNKEITIYLFSDNEIIRSATYGLDETAISNTFDGLNIDLVDVFGN